MAAAVIHIIPTTRKAPCRLRVRRQIITRYLSIAIATMVNTVAIIMSIGTNIINLQVEFPEKN